MSRDLDTCLSRLADESVVLEEHDVAVYTRTSLRNRRLISATARIIVTTSFCFVCDKQLLADAYDIAFGVAADASAQDRLRKIAGSDASLFVARGGFVHEADGSVSLRVDAQGDSFGTRGFNSFDSRKVTDIEIRSKSAERYTSCRNKFPSALTPKA